MTRIDLSLLLIVACLTANAGDFVAPVAGREGLVLSLPEGWSARLDQSMPGLPPTVEIMSPDRTAFQILVTPIPTADGRTMSLSELRRLVVREVAAVSSNAEEQIIPIQGFVAPDKGGYYFSSTDPQPEPGGYKYLTQGALAFGGISVTFTVLSNRVPVEVARKAITMLRTAHRSPNAE